MAPAFREHRPMIVGNDQPETPYPMLLEGIVTRGFGRGARFLGIPTGTIAPRPVYSSQADVIANLPDSSLQPLNDLHMTGIYYGFARIHPSTTTPHPTAPSTPSVSGTTTPQAAGKHHSSPLSASTIQSIPASTAPYPPDSVPGDIAPPKRLDAEDGRVWPMVMSVGWNPYFKNEKITAVRAPAFGQYG
jgi:riboflavin kinase